MARILFIEDDPVLQFLLKKVIEQGGHETCVATDGAEAERQLAAFDPDLLLLDIMLPDIDGFSLLERLRQRFDPLQLPIIMLSAKSAPEDVVRALNAGANDYLVKPAHHQELRARIDNQLRLRALAKRS